MSSFLSSVFLVLIFITLTSAQTTDIKDIKVYKTKWNTGWLTTLRSFSYGKILTMLALIIPAVTLGAVILQMGYFLMVYFKMIGSVVIYKLASFYGIPFVFDVVVDAAKSYISNFAGLDHEVNDLATDVIKM